MLKPEKKIDRDQVRALTNPIRFEIYTSLRTDGPATARELARRIDGSEMSLYYHLRLLAKNGLLHTESRPTATKPETVFSVGGSLVVELDLSDERNLMELQRNMSLLLRSAAKESCSAAASLRNSFHDRSMIARQAVRLSPETALELKEKLLELTAWVRERSDEAGERYSVTFAATPLVGKAPDG